MRNILEKITFL